MNKQKSETKNLQKLQCPHCDVRTLSVYNIRDVELRIREDRYIAATTTIKCNHCDRKLTAWFTFDGLTE